jgi:hypothetical protein
VNGSNTFAGGSFQTVGKTAHASLMYSIPISLVSVPQTAASVSLALRLSPNPARGAVRLEYDLPAAAPVDVSIFDVQGRRIARPVSEALVEPGTHETIWDPAGARHLPGVYFARMQTPGRTLLQRFVLIGP